MADDRSEAEIEAFIGLLGKPCGEQVSLLFFCPFEDHRGQRPTFSVYQGQDDGRMLWRCRECGQSGVGVQSLMAAMDMLGDQVLTPHTVVLDDDDPQQIVENCHERLINDDNALNFLAGDRCIGRTTVESMFIGIDSCGFYTFPAYDADGNLISIKGRKWRRPKGWRYLYGKRALFGRDAITAARDTHAELLLCMGEPDTAAARSAGYLSVGVPGPKPWNDDWNIWFTDIDVTICFDAGIDYRPIADAIYEYARRVRVVKWAERKKGHDLTTELRAGTASALRALLNDADVYQPATPGAQTNKEIDWTRTQHARIPLTVLYDDSLKPIDKETYCKLQARIGNRGEWAQVEQETIATWVGVSRQTVIASLKRLESAGYLQVWPEPYPKATNRYKLST